MLRGSPAVAGVMSVESGKSRITCDHARATVAASLLQLWRLFGSLKPSMKLVSTYAGGVLFLSAAMHQCIGTKCCGFVLLHLRSPERYGSPTL